MWNQCKGTDSKVIDKEYDAFLNDMGVKDKKNELDAIPSISGGIGGGGNYVLPTSWEIYFPKLFNIIGEGIP